jgi:hypothetical protein
MPFMCMQVPLAVAAGLDTGDSPGVGLRALVRHHPNCAKNADSEQSCDEDATYSTGIDSHARRAGI